MKKVIFSLILFLSLALNVNALDKDLYDHLKENALEDLYLQVDGGINADTARVCTSYGANSLVAGNYIFKSENICEAIKSLR